METEWMAVGHQVSMWPHLPIMSWCYLIHWTIKLDMHSKLCYKMEVEYGDQVWAGRKGKRQNSQVAQIPMVSPPHTSLPLPQPTLVPSWLVPPGWLEEEGKSMGLISDMAPYSREKQLLYSTLTRCVCRWWVCSNGGNSPGGHILGWCIYCPLAIKG